MLICVAMMQNHVKKYLICDKKILNAADIYRLYRITVGNSRKETRNPLDSFHKCEHFVGLLVH